MCHIVIFLDSHRANSFWNILSSSISTKKISHYAVFVYDPVYLTYAELPFITFCFILFFILTFLVSSTCPGLSVVCRPLNTYGFPFCQRDLTKRWDDIAVAAMVADMAANMEVHMVADMEVDKVAAMVAFMLAGIVTKLGVRTQFGRRVPFFRLIAELGTLLLERVGHGGWLIGPKLFSTRSLPDLCVF